MAKGRKTGGRQLGTPNKISADVRAAMAKVLQTSAPEFQRWLYQVADGIPKRVHEVTDKDGTKRIEVTWLRAPNPHKALDLVIALSEYHIPKLSRTELAGGLDQNITIERRYFTRPPP